LNRAPENIHALVQFIAQHNFKAKLVLFTKQTAWVDWLSIPVPGYLDYGGVPVSFSMVSAIKLSPLVKIHIGRLLPPVVQNHTEEIERYLKQMGYCFQIEDEDFVIPF